MSKPTITEVRERFAAYHEKNPAWGSLHLVLDNDNVRDSDVCFCLQWAENVGDMEGAELAQILLAMSETQRLKIGRTA